LRYAAFLLVFIGCTAGMGLFAHARDTARPTGGVLSDEKASEAVPPRFAHTREVPMELLDRQPRAGLILPSEPATPDEVEMFPSQAVVGQVPHELRRLPEGYVLGGRCARIERDGDGWVAILEPTEELPEAPPLRLLANQRLQMIETVLTDTDEPIVFLLTGRVSEFGAANYLLIEHVAQLPAGARCEPAGPVIPPPEVPVTAVPPPAAEASAPSQAAEPAGAGRVPTAEDVARELMATEPVRAVVMPETMTRVEQSDEPSEAPGPAERLEPSAGPSSGDPSIGEWPEGTLLIDRVGRVVLGDDGWWMLAFEDQGHNARLQPVRLLPNRLLEEALSLSEGGTRGVVFEVSGEITVYRNVRHLLLRKVLVRRDIGNFR